MLIDQLRGVVGVGVDLDPHLLGDALWCLARLGSKAEPLIERIAAEVRTGAHFGPHHPLL